MAILIALFSFVLLIFLALEVSYETQVEYVSASQSVNRLKAYYAAKAGVELSLLRIQMFQQANASLGNQLGEARGLLNLIWQFPFSWPAPATEDMNAVERDLMNRLTEESFMDANFLVTIQGEGGKLDINDLGSPYEELSSQVQAQVLQIFEREKERDTDFSDRYRNFNFQELVNNIADWVDEDSQSRNGGDESRFYDQPSDSNLRLPPNRPFMTIQELHMVAGMEDELFEVLLPHITIYGVKGININSATSTTLKALDNQIDDRIVSEIMSRRSDPMAGPFRNEQDFIQFLRSVGMNTQNLEALELPMHFGAEHNFRIVSSGQFAWSRREITAVTFDIENLTSRMVEILDKVDEAENPQAPTGPPDPPAGSGGDDSSDTTETYSAPKGRPRVVYWQET